MKKRNWSESEVKFLQDGWGARSKEQLSRMLGRSFEAVSLKAARLGLGDARHHLDGITLNVLADSIGVHYQTVGNWTKKYGLPVKEKVTARKWAYKYIKMTDWWDWAEKNKHMIDFTRFEEYALPPEPDWVNAKRKADFEKKELLPKPHNTPWTSSDENRLKKLVAEGKTTYPEISKQLQRSQGAIKRKIRDIGIENNIPRMPNHHKYTAKDIETLESMMSDGHSFVEISIKLGRSESAVRGKAERMGYKFKNGVPYKNNG